MTDNKNERTCPFCLQDNRCAVADISSCWCRNIAVPEALLALVPEQYKNNICICQRCIVSFNDDPQLFVYTKKQIRVFK